MNIQIAQGFIVKKQKKKKWQEVVQIVGDET